MASKGPRENIILECTECKRRTYMTDKNKRSNPDRLEIKKYCNALRKRASSKEVPLSPFLSILHDAFVSDSCRLILFEKADYIRDRAIYRPSHVSSFTDTPIQTSKNTREQIDSMPDSETIHLEIQRIIVKS